MAQRDPGARQATFRDAGNGAIMGRRARKLRPNRMTVAPQVWGKAGCTPHSDQSLQRTRYGGLPSFEPALGGAVLNPSTSSRSGKALVPRGRTSGEPNARSLRSEPLGGWSESAVLDPMQPVPDSGTGTLQVSRRETLEKPETDSIIAEQLGGWKGLMTSMPKVFCPVPRNPKRGATSGFATGRR